MYNLESLNYEYFELEPLISSDSLYIHHEILHKGYLDKLNVIAKANPELFDKPIDKVLYNINEIPEELQSSVIRFGGGYSNHNLFFENLMPPNDFTTLEYSALESDMDKLYGGKEKVEEALKNTMITFFGSGWVFLAVSQDNKLVIMKTKEQNSPLIDKYIPIIAIDMWEHSFYLDTKQDKAKYADNIIKLLNWKVANDRYIEAIQTL